MILEVKNITKDFALEKGAFKSESGAVRALDRVSFSLDESVTLGLAGESGSGKTTLAKIILKLIPPTSGEVSFIPEIITDFRKDVQIIFQNPYNSLDPKMRVHDTVAEPLLIHRICAPGLVKAKVTELFNLVGLKEGMLDRFPAEFSGGERQRICIARALASSPKLLVLDEPISSLDLTVQAKMLDLLRDLKKRLNLTYIFISHNLAVVKALADKVIIMKDGKIVEEADKDKLFSDPQSAYTKLLLEAARGR